MTQLGPLAGALRLRDVGIEDRLAELVFELPLAGGDATTATITLGMLAPLLRRHLGPDDPLQLRGPARTSILPRRHCVA
jgi:exodeoxyribonuclease V beta subunit